MGGRLRDPIVTGSSVVAFKYKDGIMMAADTLGTAERRSFSGQRHSLH